ncbi:MAG TPA: hypothetical protein VGP86_16420 [Xanthobacteraceae bacterium]|jgi:hypothetical protein|nr:hypothetical protein [Xanthobacteraceae bacterium]
MRAAPCTSHSAPSFSPIALVSRLGGASRNEDERATTPSPRTLVSATAISSVMPPAKKSWLVSPELLSSGSTAIV